jgi:glycine cleavage system transcriptional repressor
MIARAISRRGETMTHYALVTVFTQDRAGLVAALAGCLHDLGINLGDTTFAVLGEGAEFAAICEAPAHLSLAELERALRELPDLADAEVSVARFPLHPVHPATAQITHRVELRGRDRPGVVARVAEIFTQYKANIVRLNSEKVPGPKGDAYAIHIAAWIPPERTDAGCRQFAGRAIGPAYETLA